MADTDPRITKARKILREGMTRGTKALEGSTNRATGTRALYQEGHRAAVEALKELGGKVPEGAEVRSRGGQPGAKRATKAKAKNAQAAKKTADSKRSTKSKASKSKASKSTAKSPAKPKENRVAARPDLGVPAPKSTTRRGSAKPARGKK